MEFNSTHLAIDLILLYYDTVDPFEIQNLLEEELGIDVHINEILNHEKINNNINIDSYYVNERANV